MTPRIAITGTTGQIGGRVLAQLLPTGLPLRQVVRSQSRASRHVGVEVVEAAYAATPVQALAGADILFMVSGAEHPDRLRDHKRFIDTAREAGVKHVVYTSFLAAAPTATFTLARDHWETEQHIIASGLDYTFLRDNFYSEVLVDFVGPDNVLRGPGRTGAVSAVSRQDVAHVAATVLADVATGSDRHRCTTYDLTGPAALTLAEIAAILTELRGTPVTYHAETVPEAYESRASYRPEPWQADAWVSTYTAIAAGELAAVSTDIHTITGAEPLSFRAAAAAWLGDNSTMRA